MPSATITRSTAVQRPPRVMQLEGLFDIPPAKRSDVAWQVEIPIDSFDWNVGLIVGPSGSGKSTLARRFWPNQLVAGYKWSTTKSIVDGFPKHLPIKEITGLLCSVGFSSPPAWLRPFAVLSTGEQFRVTIARAMAEASEPRASATGVSRQTKTPGANASGSLIVIDEFTSVVDRTVARIGSSAIAKTIRRRKQQFIAVTCHYDVLDWLQPDWVYDLGATGVADAASVGKSDAGSVRHGAFTRRSLRRRPAITLEIRRVDRSLWKLFAHHHYLTGSLSTTGICFAAFFADRPVAFCAAMHFMHPRSPGWREHRTVCLPDFQGVGIGNALSEFVASCYAAKNVPYRSTTSHPAMIAHRAKSPLWHMFRPPSRNNAHAGAHKHTNRDRDYWATIGAINRLSASFEYVGPANPAAAAGFGVVGPGEPGALATGVSTP